MDFKLDIQRFTLALGRPLFVLPTRGRKLRRSSKLHVSEIGALFIPKLPTLGKPILGGSS